MQQKLLQLIRLLADGTFHSGESIAFSIGISRTAVWKKIKKCIDLGVEIESVKGKGYRMLKPFEVLNREVVCKYLSPGATEQFTQIEFFEEIDSTNRHALDYVDSHGPTPYICFAEYQTSGRGRRGRSWYSPLGNIAFSLVWHFERGAAALEGLSLLIGLAVVRALKAEGIDGVSLKWPNDVLYSNHKLAGILLEMKGDPQGLCHVVIGVGINTALPQEIDSIDQPFASLYDLNPKLSRNRLCAQLLNELALMVPAFFNNGFSTFKESWMRYDAYKGKKVRLLSGEREQLGIARGVSDNGALILEEQGELREVHAGELSLRLLDDS